MKTLIVTALILISSLTYAAEFTNLQAVELSNSIAYSAEMIMQGRQQGVAIDKAMSVKVDPKIQKIITLIIIEAYKAPLMPTKKLKEEVTREFKTRIFVLTYENLTK